jgi:hypothetical protein
MQADRGPESLKNIGTDNIRLVFIFSTPGFEKNLRCGSALVWEAAAPPIDTDELKACAHEALAPAAKK